MTEQEKRKYLEDHGWSLWYSPNYWVHPKTVANPSTQDYTNYGMDLERAYKFETENLPKFKSVGMPELSKYLYDWNMS